MSYSKFVDVTPHLNRVIAVDFDGCLCKNAWPEVGEPNWDVIEKVKKEHENGADIILWTCRDGQLLEDAVKACEDWGINLSAANESLVEWRKAWGNDTRKIGASEYWDDKAHNPIKNRWIPIEEKYPEDGVNVLVQLKDDTDYLWEPEIMAYIIEEDNWHDEYHTWLD